MFCLLSQQCHRTVSKGEECENTNKKSSEKTRRSFVQEKSETLRCLCQSSSESFATALLDISPQVGSVLCAFTTSWPWKRCQRCQTDGWTDIPPQEPLAFSEVAGAGRKCMEIELLLLLLQKKISKTGGVSLPLLCLDLGGQKGKINLVQKDNRFSAPGSYHYHKCHYFYLMIHLTCIARIDKPCAR